MYIEHHRITCTMQAWLHINMLRVLMAFYDKISVRMGDDFPWTFPHLPALQTNLQLPKLPRGQGNLRRILRFRVFQSTFWSAPLRIAGKPSLPNQLHPHPKSACPLLLAPEKKDTKWRRWKKQTRSKLFCRPISKIPCLSALASSSGDF